MTEAAAEPPPAHDLVPGWLERLAAIGWRLLAAILLGLVLLYIAVQLWTVTASILVAAIVAATFAPYVLGLRNRGWSRIKAAAAVFLGAAFVIIATLIIIAIAFIPYIQQVVDRHHAGRRGLPGETGRGCRVPPEVGLRHRTWSRRGIQAWLSASVAGIAGDIGDRRRRSRSSRRS